MLSAKTALQISTVFGMVFFLMFIYSPHGALIKYEIYTPPAAVGKKKPAEPTALEWTCLYYFIVLIAVAMFSLTGTMSAVARIGHANTMKLSCAAGALGRAALLAFIFSKPLTDPMKKQLVFSGGLLVVQVLGATTGGMPTMPVVAMPKSYSGKSCLLTASLALVQVTIVWFTGPVEYMTKFGLVVGPQAASAFDFVTSMWCIVMASAALNRVVVVLAGDKDTIYACNRTTVFYYAMMVGVMCTFKAAMTPGGDSPTAAGVQLLVLFVYFIISVYGLITDDEAGYTKDKKKK